MKQNNLTNGLMAAMLLASPMVGAETQYPAADFQPKVIYQDAEQIAKHSEAAQKSGSASASQEDSRYPAANFQPKVLYKDKDYKPSPSSTAAPVSTKQQSKAASSETVAAGETEKSKQGGNNWIFFAVLAVAGIIFFNRRSKSATQAGADYRAASRTSGGVAGDYSGTTGVARYLNRTMGTGVSRYLEKQAKTEKAITGVAKYMAKQTVSAKAKASENITGVEKYMRNRG